MHNFGLQAHFSQLELPITDYVTDLKSVLDQSIRIIQAMIDICANSGWLSSSIICMHLLQMVMQVFISPCSPADLFFLSSVAQFQYNWPNISCHSGIMDLSNKYLNHIIFFRACGLIMIRTLPCGCCHA